MIEWTGPFFFLLLKLVSCDPRYSAEIYHRELTSGIFKQSHVLLVKKNYHFLFSVCIYVLFHPSPHSRMTSSYKVISLLSAIRSATHQNTNSALCLLYVILFYPSLSAGRSCLFFAHTVFTWPKSSTWLKGTIIFSFGTCMQFTVWMNK